MTRIQAIMDKTIAGMCFTFFFFAVAPAFAEPVVNVKTEYYEVHGANMKEVRRSMDEERSRMADKFVGRDAFTDYKISAKWGNPLLVTLDLSFIVPKWVECAQAPKGLQEKWQHYMKMLQVHEDGHRKIAEDLARAIEKLGIAAGGKSGEKLIQDITNIYAEYDKKQFEYNRKTQDGRNQGVHFPIE
jgi:predicted secreted Zn-dependent protease